MKNLIISIKAFIIFSILLGLIYPLAITGIAQVVFPQKANGSLIIENGKIIGSSLIGQKFDKSEYFNSRPSAVDYNASGSGASNFGPTNKKFMEKVKDRIVKEDKKRRGIEAWENDNELNYASTHPRIYASLPADMVLASASGLDPYISIENAKIQAKRVAKTRGISEEKVSELITQNKASNFLGIWGQEGVNVLKLNIALDKLK